MSIVAKRHVALRIHPDDIKRIDKLATARNMSRTEYMTATALGKLDRVGLEARFDDLTERLRHLEHRVGLEYD